MSCHLLTEG